MCAHVLAQLCRASVDGDGAGDDDNDDDDENDNNNRINETYSRKRARFDAQFDRRAVLRFGEDKRRVPQTQRTRATHLALLSSSAAAVVAESELPSLTQRCDPSDGALTNVARSSALSGFFLSRSLSE